MGVQIEDNIPLTEEEMETMFVDLLPDDMPENDGTAKVSCFLDDTFDVQEIKDKVAAEIRRLSEFLPVGTGEITESETKEEDWETTGRPTSSHSDCMTISSSSQPGRKCRRMQRMRI